MYGREELKYKMLDKGGYQGETKAYIKEDADNVMDSMEARIKELEEDLVESRGVNAGLRLYIKELEEEEIIRQMGDFAEFCKKEKL